MYTLLLVVLLLALFFDTAAATSPTMDPTLSVPIEPFSEYPDTDDMLDALCQVCRYSVCICNCMIHQHHFLPPHLPTFTPEAFTPGTFLDHPEWPQEAAYEEPQAELQPPALLPTSPFIADQSPRLIDANVRRLDDNGTTIPPRAIQVHVENTYNPGDRLEAASRSSSRRTPHRRQQPRPGGFPCPVDGCARSFDRSCDLKRHKRTHLSRSERPHKCSVCNEGFLYPKDRVRHQRTHNQSPSPSATLYCPVPGCANVDGFSRRDNLLRHQRNQHPTLVMTA